jgi:hypothetical protein
MPRCVQKIHRHTDTDGRGSRVHTCTLADKHTHTNSQQVTARLNEVLQLHPTLCRYADSSVHTPVSHQSDQNSVGSVGACRRNCCVYTMQHTKHSSTLVSKCSSCCETSGSKISSALPYRTQNHCRLIPPAKQHSPVASTCVSCNTSPMARYEAAAMCDNKPDLMTRPHLATYGQLADACTCGCILGIQLPAAGRATPPREAAPGPTKAPAFNTAVRCGYWQSTGFLPAQHSTLRAATSYKTN